MTLEERKDKAMRLRRDGYNCSQAVLLAMSDITGLDDDIAAQVAVGFGGGVGGMKEVCGAVSAMAIASGLIEKAGASDKQHIYEEVQQFALRFKERSDGRILCRDLKAPGAARPCNMLIEDAIEILHSKYAAPE